MPPPLAPATAYRSQWNQFGAGEGGPSYDIVALPFYEGARAAAATGFSEETFQRVWLSALVGGAAAAVVFFSLGVLSSPVAGSAAGLLATFNPYSLVTGATSVPTAAILVGALLGGLVLRAGRSDCGRHPSLRLHWLRSAASSCEPSASPTHPAFVVLAFALVAATRTTSGVRAAGAFLARALPVALLVNLWWIVPAALTIAGSGFAERFATPAVEDWAWTHARASLVNAASLNTTWAWTYPEYFPYSHRLAQPPFDFLRFFALTLAVIGLVLARGRERRAAIVLAVFGLATVWIAKGLHPPLPGANAWLYDHVPGFWLLRDPGKMLAVQSLVLALLGGMAVAALVRSSRPWRAVFGPVVAGVLVAGSVAYVHPLSPGRLLVKGALSTTRPMSPVSDDWRRMAAYLDAQPPEGKIVVLPAGDFYQLPTTWGYYGVSFARLIIDRPVVEPGTASYFSTASAVTSTVDSLERDLVEGNSSAVLSKLGALGARYILLRRDLDRDMRGRMLVSPDALARGLARVPGLAHARSFGLLDVYRVETDSMARFSLRFRSPSKRHCSGLPALSRSRRH